jgi:aminopeptidase-like protein
VETSKLMSNEMYQWCESLFPLNRSLSGSGNLETLQFLKNLLPELQISSVNTEDELFDWIAPEEWNVEEAYIETLKGVRIVDWANSNLHLVGYSIPVDTVIDVEELIEKLFYLDSNHKAIPYKTSYYKRDWGFCVAKEMLEEFVEPQYRVVIKSSLKKGHLIYGEAVLPGSSRKEIILSSYICHPSMANNELSGPVVLTALLLHLKQMKNRYYTYRASFHPETIGAIAFIKRHQLDVRNSVVGVWNFTCMGGPDDFSLMPSKYAQSIPERITIQALKNLNQSYVTEDFLHRGSDERQFTSPGVDIPTVSLMRSMYGRYDQYHTSLDDLDFISQTSLDLSLSVMIEVIRILEETKIYKSNKPCEPFLSKYQLQNGIEGNQQIGFRDVLNVHAFCDGKNTLTEIADYCRLDIATTEKICDTLLKEGIIY